MCCSQSPYLCYSVCVGVIKIETYDKPINLNVWLVFLFLFRLKMKRFGLHFIFEFLYKIWVEIVDILCGLYATIWDFLNTFAGNSIKIHHFFFENVALFAQMYYIFFCCCLYTLYVRTLVPCKRDEKKTAEQKISRFKAKILRFIWIMVTLLSGINDSAKQIN